ncbi:gamma-glutamyltranspeptidase / glutathione hydrolase [Friedmanniella luteola]|uniref:Glutathione hydrolase proenzyme n=1 Tax=Friedmanniella luteola TaxID=546871 RepID=A0A1H1LQE5_9ACTN|nr:gamma-glutamyltransferase [Friedmanniella luteola]SDR76275.1 gamma-glutamyltranspeptidase / glutathione hydrolase [Friedmanniella luteola]
MTTSATRATTPGRRGWTGLLGVAVTGAALVAGGLAPAAAAPAPAAPAAPASASGPAPAAARQTEKNAVAFGTGGAVASVDPEATEAGLRVLRAGGNAVDAAVATAAALGVTEPYSAGVGGGGYLVHYDARTRRVATLDGRETAPAGAGPDTFLDDAGKPYTFAQLVTSGRSVGVPGTPATWEEALDRWGTLSLRQALRPAVRIARRGFVVDETFHRQTVENQTRFRDISTTADLFLPDGDAPAVGSVFRNPDLAATYEALGREGADVLYRGRIGRDIARTVQDPPTAVGAALPVPAGTLARADLARYRVLRQAPTRVRYRGLDVWGMAPSSSGGTTVGEALNILGTQRLAGMDDEQVLHHYLDASALAFADRTAYVGDPAFVDVPTRTLLSRRFARTRACLVDPVRALPTPTPPGDLDARGCRTAPPAGAEGAGTSTTHLVTADRWGDVVSYTLTIEQTGGSGIVVPGRGFLLNNELTDFTTAYDPDDPNRIEPGKRPRSSMAPTIVTRRGRPVLALGSPGGSTIITTVLQTLVNRVDLGLTLPEAVAAPRASHRNNATVSAEQAFIDRYGPALSAVGYTFTPSGAAGTSAAEIGAVTALEFFPRGRVQAVAEPVRRGGGDAGVVRPRSR